MSQAPFKKNMGLIQAVSFHPSAPLFYCANQVPTHRGQVSCRSARRLRFNAYLHRHAWLQRHVRVYNLAEQVLVKKLASGCRWISSMDVHPQGEHLLLGSYDKKVVWFDVELSSKP